MARSLADYRNGIENLFRERQNRLAFERGNYRRQVPLLARPFAFLAYHEVIRKDGLFQRHLCHNLPSYVSARKAWKKVKDIYGEEATKLVNSYLSEIANEKVKNAIDANTAPYSPGENPYMDYDDGGNITNDVGRQRDQENLHELQGNEITSTNSPGTPRGALWERTDAIRLLRTRHLFRGAGWHSWRFEGNGPMWFQPTIAAVLGVVGGVSGFLLGGVIFGGAVLPLLAGGLLGGLGAAIPFLIPQRGLIRKDTFALKIDTPVLTLRAGSQAGAIGEMREFYKVSTTEIMGRYSGIISDRRKAEEFRERSLPAVLNFLNNNYLTFNTLLNHVDQESRESLRILLTKAQENTKRDIQTTETQLNSTDLLDFINYMRDRAKNERLHTEEIREIHYVLTQIERLMREVNETNLKKALGILNETNEPALANARAIARDIEEESKKAQEKGKEFVYSPEQLRVLANNIGSHLSDLASNFSEIARRLELLNQLRELINRASPYT